MRKATKTVAMWFGIAAGIAGLEHGYFEILQGSTPPASLAFPSMGPPCDPEVIWNACEPAMSILPNFLLTGILAMLIGLALIVWSAAFVQRKHGGLVLILLSIALLLFGGGFFPPLIGIIGGVAGTRINQPISGKPGRVTRFGGQTVALAAGGVDGLAAGAVPGGLLLQRLLERHHGLWPAADPDHAAAVGLYCLRP